MKIFTSEEVNRAFERQAMGKMSVIENLKRFQNYDDFERYQFKKRKPVWINALIVLSGCKKRNDLELQWDLFGKIFRKFHGEHIEWLKDQSKCPLKIREDREKELKKVISSFATNSKCHWRRNHKFVCFCIQNS